jgi:hypothetical protein
VKRAVLAFAALVAGQAEAARPSCVEPRDMRTLISVALPEAVESLTDHCSGSLPPEAFLPNEGKALANRYRREAPMDPLRVRHAVEAVTGQNLSGFASDDTVIGLARQYISDQIEHHVPTQDCATADGMVALAAPLRANAMTEAILLALELAGPDQAHGLAVCPAKEEGRVP